MSAERRYSEQEIAAIFRRAAADHDAAQRRLAPGDGLTLAEISAIGKEVGITPEFIARAAATLDQATPTPPPKTTLGLAVSVARTVDLPGAFTEEDWNLLVADLHETFHAHGEVRREGALRKWQTGNLQVLVEPTASGHRLRLRTLNETARGGLLGSLLLFVMGLSFTLAVAAKGGIMGHIPELLFVSMFSAVGLGGMGFTAYRLPRWRKERARQMDTVAARALERAGRPTAHAPAEAASAPQIDLDRAADEAENEQTRPARRSRT